MVPGDDTRDLLTADEGGNDAGTDDEGQDEAVHAVPVRSKALDGSPGVIVVEESEGKELGDQGVLNGEQQSRPGNGGGNDTSSIASVAGATTVTSPLETPVDGSKKREDLYIYQSTFVSGASTLRLQCSSPNFLVVLTTAPYPT